MAENGFSKKEMIWLSAFLLACLAAFMPEIMTFKEGFLGGDYGQQFFPYSKWYAENIKSFRFPSYTSLIGCGYSVLSEGQAGIFYPINFLLFYILPLVAAYQISVILHFILGSLFSYLFIRNKGISIWASVLFSLVFVFGANICGIRYNTVVQKVLVWFPLSLYLIDRFFSSKQYRFLAGASIIFILQIFAGFLQIALYCIGFSALYFFTRLFCEERKKGVIKIILAFCAFLAGTLALASVQLIPALNGVASSTRMGKGMEFSLWGSSTPFVFLTLVFPRWDFLVEGSLYIGIALLPFLILFLGYFKGSPRDIKIYFFLFILSLILALGAFTPVLPFLLKISGASFIRKPSKFLFIGTFFISACAVWALDNFYRALSEDRRRFLIRSWSVLILFAIVIFISGNIALSIFGQDIIKAADGYVKSHIFDKPNHPYALDIYYAKVRSFFEALRSFISVKNPYNWLSFIFMGAMLGVLFLKRYAKTAVMCILMMELFVYSQYATGLKGNFIPWKEFLKKPAYVEFLENDKTPYRIYNYFTKETENDFYGNFRLIENMNMLFGISSIGLYAPVVDRDYYELVKGLGTVDDSLGRQHATKEMLAGRLRLLAFLGVKYIISFEDLSRVGPITEVYAEGRLKIYRLDGNMPPVFFANSVKMVKDKEEALRVIKGMDYKPSEYVVSSDAGLSSADLQRPRNAYLRTADRSEGKLVIESQNDVASLLVRNERLEGWTAYIDAKKTHIYTVNGIFTAVLVPKGKHKVEFRYNPYL